MKKSACVVFTCLLIFIEVVFFTASVKADESAKYDIHGYISQGFLLSSGYNYTTETEKGTFQFNELGINFSTNIHDRLRVGLQLAARDLGNTGNDRVIVDWAFADYRWKDWLGIRAGKIKMPMGFYNETRDLDMLRTPVLLPQGVYNENYRDGVTALKGVSLYGRFSLKTLGYLSYKVLIGSVSVDNDSSTEKGIEGLSPVDVSFLNYDTAFNWSVIWEPPLEGLRLGFSYIATNLDIEGTLNAGLTVPVDFPPYQLVIAPAGTPLAINSSFLSISVISLEYTFKNLVLAAECYLLNLELITRISGLEPATEELPTLSFYGSAAYRFNDWFEASFYYMEHYRDRHDRKGLKNPMGPPYRHYQKDATLSLRFDINHHWTFKMEGHFINGSALPFPQDNLNDEGIPEFAKDWYLFAAKMTFSF